MSELLRRSIWFGRPVLGVGALLFTQLALGDVLGPVAVAAKTHTTLGSPDAITVVRVQGGVFGGIAVVLVYCLVSQRRLLAGLGFLATIITSVAALRLIGLMLDGPGPFTLMVLKPEVALSVLSACAVLLERRRSRGLASKQAPAGDGQ
jgi:Domain of unknown function (DUF4345)